MLTNEMKRNAFRVLATLALAAAPAFASPIFVNNYSFETLPAGGMTTSCATGGCISGGPVAIPGWTSTALSGQGQVQLVATPPGTPQWNSVPDSSTFAFSNGPTIYQTVGTVAAGHVYTLQVDVGERIGFPVTGSIDLLINGNTYTGTGTPPTAGNWSNYIATYTGTTADAGQAIVIELHSSGAQAGFDNVRLDFAPEPASFLLIGPALLFLGLRKIRTVRS
jgi:hypothetical protein